MSKLQSFFDWGLNCQVMKLPVDRASKVIDSWESGGREYLAEELDAFWNGYHNGSRSSGEIVSVKI